MENTTVKINQLSPGTGNPLPKHLLCFSHLRWDFVFQRPQQILSRLAKHFNIYFFEEPLFDASDHAYLTLSNIQKNLSVIVPHLPANLDVATQNHIKKELLDRLLNMQNLSDFIFWYYTPMALEFSNHLHPKMIIYDCMDELSAFKFAPTNLGQLERLLFKKVDLAFTGGHSLYDAKKNLHDNIYSLPSSIEQQHFGRTRKMAKKKKNKNNLKLGFFGVIDERFDIELIKSIAEKRPHWTIELIGPTAKIDPDNLPKQKNIIYTGPVAYSDLPQYLANWDIALIPFLINESTRYISPTKTPEYLAAGLPVISSPIRDVVRPYGIQHLVKIAKDCSGFLLAADELSQLSKNEKKEWLQKVDQFLAQTSWEKTCDTVLEKLINTLQEKAMVSVA